MPQAAAAAIAIKKNIWGYVFELFCQSAAVTAASGCTGLGASASVAVELDLYQEDDVDENQAHVVTHIVQAEK